MKLRYTMHCEKSIGLPSTLTYPAPTLKGQPTGEHREGKGPSPHSVIATCTCDDINPGLPALVISKPVANTIRSVWTSPRSTSLIPVGVKQSIRSVITVTLPSLITLKKSPSGQTHTRCSHGLYRGTKFASNSWQNR